MSNPKRLWQPTQLEIDQSNLASYMQWLNTHKNLTFKDYQVLWEWSVQHIEEFWESLWAYFNIISSTPYQQVMSSHQMPGVQWFTGAKVNYAEHVFRQKTTQHPALVFKNEHQPITKLSWKTLEQEVAAMAAFLKAKGVQPGDRVAAYLPNIPQATIAFLATNSLGAVWSSTSPDFGSSSVIDRFAQISPKVFITVDGYTYGGKLFDKTTEVNHIITQLPGLEQVVIVPYLNKHPKLDYQQTTFWKDIIASYHAPLEFTHIPFNDPMWVLYSSGTTGKPKAITQSMGGILLEHLKYLTFHNDVKPGEHCFWYTTTGWMMWNYIQSSLLCGATVVLYDGSPAYPSMEAMWQFIEEANITHFGTSAGFISASMKAEVTPGESFNYTQLRSIGSTGSPLSPEGFDWIYQQVKPDVWLASISGGSDVCSAFVGGNPTWPVYTGEIQCRALGCNLEAFNNKGKPVYGQMGEMVITQPMPSMPIYFWGDPEFKKYKESYFNMFAGIWRHGDWTEITPRQGIIIYGRSDATLNRGGIRIGTSEIYRATESLEEVQDSLVVYLDNQEQDFMPLFVVPAPGYTLNEALVKKIKATIRKAYTPRHVPDKIIAIKEVPYTISGKKMETPVKKILQGEDAEKISSKDAMRNPNALEFFINLNLSK